MRPGTNLALRRRARRLSRSVGAAALGLAATAGLVQLLARRAERRHPPTGTFVAVDDIHLHVIDRGPRAAPPVVLLHGNGAMIADWEISGVLGRLARDHRVVAFDRPGFGHSERPRDRPWTATRQAHLLWHALERMGVENPILVGHSWGAIVALAMAEAAQGRPERRVRGLVLAAGYYYPTRRPESLLFGVPATPVLGDMLNATVNPLLGALLGQAVIARMFDPLPIPPRFRADYPMPLALRPGQLRTLGEASVLMVPSAAALVDRYPWLNVPAVILAGTEDRIFSTEDQAERLARELPLAELRLFPGVGHIIHHARPDAITDAVARIERATENAVVRGSSKTRRRQGQVPAEPAEAA